MKENRKKIIALVLGVFALSVCGYFLYESLTYEKTDNAQIGAHIVLLSPRVGGTLLKVNVEENQKVKDGEVLAEIDPADLSKVVESSTAQVASLQARMNEAETNYRRAEDLFKKQAISKERYDAAQAALLDTEAKLKSAQAQLAQTKLNLGYTKIIAPSDGVIAKKSAEVGQTAVPGQALFGFVSSNERWVTANFKETQLKTLKIGKKARIEVDAIPGKEFEGEVESISPSTGAVFSLLPPDNATGNFTKVVQRIPVRIRFTKLTEQEIEQLQAGLSANVSIEIH